MTQTSPRTVVIPPDRLQAFEPARLGSLSPRFREILTQIAGKKQSEVVRTLTASAEALINEDLDAVEGHALRVAVLVLRDYLLAGNYPLVADGRCFLAPILSSDSLDVRQQQQGLRRQYESARDRALRDRKQIAWIQAAIAEMRGTLMTPHMLVSALEKAPPSLTLLEAREARSGMDARTIWRCVRATWSMTPEASAPGREVALVAMDQRFPGIPLGILQFRNVVPGIRARDEWLGISTGAPPTATGPGKGFLGLVSDAGAETAVLRLEATRNLLEKLLQNVNKDGLEVPLLTSSITELAATVQQHRRLFHASRKENGPVALKNRHLLIVKRAQTALDLLRGIKVLQRLNTQPASSQNLLNDDERRDLEAGLTKLWHYHMGFVALEMSICGAAPPFGPLRAGKLMAALAASSEVADRWGIDRPLGQIAQEVYLPGVRDAVPNPGPIAVFTSGLYPGHSAQYNRVSVAGRAWKKIGETTGFGNFQVSVETAEAMRRLNRGIDGYEHITKAFGEGSGARFRSVGRALAYLGLPDLRKHETQRPLYVLPLVANPREALLGWERPTPLAPLTAEQIAEDWWKRWVQPRSAELIPATRSAEDLESVLHSLLARAKSPA